MTDRYGERPDTPQSEPAPTVSSKARTATWELVAGQQDNQAIRGGDEPAMTMAFGHDSASCVIRPTHYDRRQEQGPRREDGTRDPVRLVPVDEPAPTMASSGLATGRDVWVHDRPASTDALREQFANGERPATTIAGDSRVFPPGGHHVSGDQSAGAIRVTVAQAAALQSFPPEHPWQGSRTKQFECVGNAYPPLMAQHTLAALLGVPVGVPCWTPPALSAEDVAA